MRERQARLPYGTVGPAVGLTASGEVTGPGLPSGLVPHGTDQLILLHLFLLEGNYHPPNPVPVVI